MMKKITYLFLALLVLSCNKKAHFDIKGKVLGSERDTILLGKRIAGKFEAIDTAIVLKGIYEFSGRVEHVDEFVINKGKRDKLTIFLENTQYKIVSDTSLLKNSNVQGGDVQQLYNQYLVQYDKKWNAFMDYYREKTAEGNKLSENEKAIIDSLYGQIEDFQVDFMTSHNESAIAVHILYDIRHGKDAITLSGYIENISPDLQKMVKYGEIKERIMMLEKVAIGKKAPDFTQNDVNGSPIVLSDIYSQNKYTLIDFWASWCGPCRRENPNVVAAYNSFNDQGFDILGVSLDNGKQRWLKAIKEDSLTWTQVSDLKGWNNEFAKEYAVNSIPANFLIDQNGKIVATQLRGEALYDKLEELFNE